MTYSFGTSIFKEMSPEKIEKIYQKAEFPIKIK